MTEIHAGISISLDGYYVGPNDGPGNGMGDGGMVLHGWVGSAPFAEHPILAPQIAGLGSMITGRYGFDVAVEAWGDDPFFACPIFVVTHRAHEPIVRGRTTYHFVTGGFDEAVARAREAAGGKGVSLHGGTAIQQAIRTGVLDTLFLSVTPVLLGAGKRLFDDTGAMDLEHVATTEYGGATHLSYRRRRAS